MKNVEFESEDNLVDVVVAGPLLFLVDVEEDACLRLFLAAALSIASFLGYCMPDGVATIRLVSMFMLAVIRLRLAAFLSLFFGGPLHRTGQHQFQLKRNNMYM